MPILACDEGLEFGLVFTYSFLVCVEMSPVGPEEKILRLYHDQPDIVSLKKAWPLNLMAIAQEGGHSGRFVKIYVYGP